MRSVSPRVWLFGFVAIAGLAAAYYFILAKGTEDFVYDQQLRAQLTLAKAQSGNMTSYFKMFGNSIAAFAQSSSIDNRNSGTARDMDIFVEQRRANGLVAGIALTDNQGYVKFNSNLLGTRDVGTSLADRDYFLWAKEEVGEGDYFVGRPVISRLGASKGGMIVPVASPVFEGNVFKGVLVAAVKLSPLAERYFELLEIADSGVTLLINENGDILYSNNPGMLSAGSNLFEYLRASLFLGSMAIHGSVKDALHNSKDGTLQTDTHTVVYSPITIGNQNWLLVHFSQRVGTTGINKYFYIRHIAMFLVTAFAIVLFGVIISKENQNRL